MTRIWSVGRRFGTIAAAIVAAGCGPLTIPVPDGGPREGGPPVGMCIVSDIHVYDRSLGVMGPIFEEYIATRTDLIAESAAVFDATISAIANECCKVVIVPGDMTKDGEAASHDYVVAGFARLEAAGKQVYVVPGNHDIDNPDAVGFTEAAAVPVPTITQAEFALRYSQFGLAEAIKRDPYSLSYVAEPAHGLWLLGLDTGGAFGQVSTNTVAWAEERLAEASAAGVRVLAFGHYSLMEHFPGNQLLLPDAVVKDGATLTTQLEQSGLRLAFTGHQHVQDIAKHQLDARHLFDVGTASPVGFPSAYRTALLDSTRTTMRLRTKLLSSIDYDLGGKDLQSYVRDHTVVTMAPQIRKSLLDLGLSEELVTALEPVLVATLLAYSEGDEPRRRTPEIEAALAGIANIDGGQGAIVGSLLNGIWYDPTPDRDVELNLELGTLTDQSAP